MAHTRRYLSTKLSRLKRIGEILSEEGFITDEQLSTAAEIQESSGGALADILVSQRYVTEWELSRCLVTDLQLPFIHASLYDISSDAVNLLPHAFLHQHRLVPLDIFGTSLALATNGNISEEIVEEIEDTTNYEVMLYVALNSDIQKTLAARFPIEKLTNELSDKFDQLFDEGDGGGGLPSGDSSSPKAPTDPDEWRPEG